MSTTVEPQEKQEKPKPDPRLAYSRPVGIRLPNTTWTHLERLSEALGISRNEIAARLITRGLEIAEADNG